MKYLTYNPEQAYLLPPSVREVLGEDHVCFFLHRTVEQLDLSGFETGYVEEGRAAYHPALLLKVWLYAYVRGVGGSRRLEQRIKEDLAFRYLAAGAAPDHWMLNDFRRRPARALNDVFTQVVEIARSLGLGRLGHGAIDSTRIAANASRDRIDTKKALRAERAKIRRQIRCWQKRCDAAAGEEAPGQQIAPERMAALEARLQQIPRRLERLRKEGRDKVSATDPESRFLRDRQGFTLGDTATVAVSEDHFILEQNVTQAPTDNATLVPMVAAVEQRCGERPQKVSADSGFFNAGCDPGTGPAWHRCLCSRLEPGTGTQSRQARPTGSPAGSGPRTSAHAPEVARSGRTAGLCTPQGNRRVGVRSSEAATRDATVPSEGLGESGRGVCSGSHRVQSDPAVEVATRSRLVRKRRSAPARMIPSGSANQISR